MSGDISVFAVVIYTNTQSISHNKQTCFGSDEKPANLSLPFVWAFAYSSDWRRSDSP